MSLNKVGVVKLQGGDRAGALAAYQESLDIRRKIAKLVTASADEPKATPVIGGASKSK